MLLQYGTDFSLQNLANVSFKIWQKKVSNNGFDCEVSQYYYKIRQLLLSAIILIWNGDYCKLRHFFQTRVVFQAILTLLSLLNSTEVYLTEA